MIASSGTGKNNCGRRITQVLLVQRLLKSALCEMRRSMRSGMTLHGN